MLADQIGGDGMMDVVQLFSVGAVAVGSVVMVVAAFQARGPHEFYHGLLVEKMLAKPPVIVVLSSVGQRGQAKELLELGVSAYLTKPMRRREILGVLATVWDEHLRSDGSGQLVTRHRVREARSRDRGDEGKTDRAATKRSGSILLVEDNLVNQKVAIGLLGHLGCPVAVASNGVEALEALKEQDYDLVLMDVQMPVMDGLEATVAIRSGAVRAKSVPIVALTASAMAEDRERCLAAGMNDFLGKPINKDALSQVLDRWLATPCGVGASGNLDT